MSLTLAAVGSSAKQPQHTADDLRSLPDVGDEIDEKRAD